MSGWQRAHRLNGFDWFFTRYVRRLARSSFAGIWVRGAANVPDRGYIAAANHHSWWDGFVPYLLHHGERPASPFRIMMSDAELRRFPYFRFAGAFSVDPSSARRAREAIVYAGEEARRGAAVWMFPDGVLRPACSLPHFTSGFVHAAREGEVRILPVAMRFLFLDRQRPEVFVEFGTPLDPKGRSAREEAQGAVTRMLARIDGDVERFGRDGFELALGGRAGVDDRVALARR